MGFYRQKMPVIAAPHFHSLGRPETFDEFYARQEPLVDDDPGDELVCGPISNRAIFFSDTHLGAREACGREFLQFYNHVESPQIYMVGDIYEEWTKPVGRSAWTFEQKMRRKDRRGVARHIYTPGNHDDKIRDKIGEEGELLGNHVAVMRSATHETSTGELYLVLHGDIFDAIVRNYRVLSVLGAKAYAPLVMLSVEIDKWRQNDQWQINRKFNHLLERIGCDQHWSLAHEIKQRVDGATYNVSYKQAMLSHLFQLNAELTKRGERPINGIVGGHTHYACAEEFPSPRDKKTGLPIGPEKVFFYNTGHWTGRPTPTGAQPDQNSCTYLKEMEDGKLQLFRWILDVGEIPYHHGDVIPHAEPVNQNRSPSRPLLPQPELPIAALTAEI